MPASFILTLDTTGPQDVAVEINAGDAATGDPAVDVAVTTSDADTAGYQVKLWGDVDGVPDEATAVWQMLTPSIAVTLTSGDATKTVYARLRDDVWNESAVANGTIALDETAPTVTITAGPDVTKVSRVATKRQSAFTWTASEDIDHYEVRVVPDANSDHTAGVLLADASGGSDNLSGDGLIAATTPTTTVIDGRDLPDPDGDKTIKVFVRDVNGLWSIAP